MAFRPRRVRSEVRGRGGLGNPKPRFERLDVEYESESEARQPSTVPTRFFRDDARGVIARNQSPDVGFNASVNPYRGCEHGCAYCYARPTHEYLGMSAGLDFETRILVKHRAPELLAEELARPVWKPQPLGLSGVTDPYQPIERKLELTRGCLEVLAGFRNPVAVVTKNFLVTRDVEPLAELARHRAAAVLVSIPTLDSELARRLEPRASAPAKRLKAISQLAQAGIPAGVLIAPVIPALTDHEIPSILEAARDSGASHASWILLRMPGVIARLFPEWLEEHAPERREHVLSRIRDVRGGALNESRFGRRGRGQGPVAEQLRQLFRTAARRAGFPEERPELSAASFRRPVGDQLPLFDSGGGRE